MQVRRVMSTAGAAALAAAVAAGCGGSGGSGGSDTKSATAAGEKQVRIAFSGFAASNSFSQETFRGIKEVAAKNGATATFLDANFDSAKQIAGIQDAVTSGKFDALVINANDPNGIVAPVREAIDAGVKVIAAFVPIGSDLTTLEPQVPGLTSTIGETPSSTGENTGKIIVQACQGNAACKVAYLPGSKSLPLETIRTKGVMDVIKQHSNIKVVSDQEGGYTADQGLKTAQDVLQAHRDVNVMASSDQAIQGATKAVADAGLSGKVKLIGQGGAQQAITAIQDGSWFGAYVYVPYSEGKTAAEFAIKAVRGGKVPASLNSETLSPIGPIATKSTLGDFKGDWRS
ncbi:MAG: ribose transport system substrate-binding protein [Solirubrobacteraceae bacterium]|jgi:ribose transport system substrate-binding protein|nr:ribose transport system substrate-binding protein [Baekduia sp.]MEA2287657.1 ribose transport system substrate-binding protein [Solirubrobacteraceae bacterium]